MYNIRRPARMQRLLLLLSFLVGASRLLLGLHAFICPAAGPWQQQRQQSPCLAHRSSRSKGAALAFFDFFGGGKKAAEATEVVAEDKKGLSPAAARRAVKIQDSGPKLPALYGGWFDDSIVRDMSNALKAALKDGIRRSEIICPPIPNVEEVDFGTALNQRYNKEVAARLKAPENVARKKIVAYANVDWANRLAQKLGKRTLLAVFDQAVPASGVTVAKNAELVGINSPTVAEAGEQDVVVAIQPGTETMWSKANAVKTPAPVVGLNAPFSLSYDIGYKPSVWEQIYVVRRITKGWIFRAYPGPYKAYLETPDGKCELVKIYSKGEVPRLRDVSALIREESQARGFAILNDRYLSPRL